METDLLNNKSHIDTIEPIDASTIHRICSGQVVLSLAIAVKELVENAIDASATIIEIRLKEYGSELLEVSDNGTGVRSENFQALTIKHCTSKLREFTDLQSVETLGFRGEALSSLCALSELSVLTKHATAEHANKLKYDVNGVVIESLPAAREIGTTVILENLFASLPVRRKEFIKNLKREYSKMCQLLYAYCLVSKGIKFTCSNVTNGVKSTVLCTEGSNSIRENIISVFGHKQMSSIIQLEMVEPTDQVLEEYKVKLVPGESLPFNFDCFISNASHGNGRSTNDRQFFYINSRPCEPQKVVKLINGIYKQFNGNQYPFVYLNVNIKRSLVDVNVTPDKRQIFVDNEKLLLAVVKSSLLESFKNCPSTYTLQNIPTKLGESGGKVGSKRALNGSISDLFKKRIKCENTIKKDTRVQKLLRQVSLIECGSIQINESKAPEEKISAAVVVIENDQADKKLDKLFLIADELDEATQPDLFKTQLEYTEVITSSDSTVNITQPGINIMQSISPKIKELSFDKAEKFLSHSHCNSTLSRPTITTLASINSIKEALIKSRSSENLILENIEVNFHSQITPVSNKAAEMELEKQITKDKFKAMSIIGQFNLGFIIAKLEDDLFIIDQHATDEKYNFEMLQLNTSLDSQVLVSPKHLELTAANEDLLIENEDVFRKNGFGFLIDPTAPATKKVSLTSIPLSKNYIFGKNDIEEMLFMLQEGINPAICRPSRVQLMFATRACRKSVMVGCPLSKKDMRRLVDHMGEIDQPWNCPHGRPTMRHLINLRLLDNK